MKQLQLGLMKSPTAIGPELKPDNVRVWLDGAAYPIVQFNQIPEYNGNGTWQVQYMLQIEPHEKVSRGVWHEIKLEITTPEELRGKKIVDSGEGSVGLFLP